MAKTFRIFSFMWNKNLILFYFKSKVVQIENLKPIYVPFGTDSLEQIGLPPLSANELNDPNHKTLLDLWRTLFYKHFPQEVNNWFFIFF
jgi:hypothetical protein